MLRVYLLPTPRVDRDRGPGDSTGQRQPFVGSGWTRTDRVGRILPTGPARARACNISRTAFRKTGPTVHPLVRLAAMGSCRRRLSRARALAPAYQESRLASRCEREQPTSEKLQAANPRQSGADSSEPALLRAEMTARSGSERRSAVEAIRRFINQSPGCRQGTSARSWRRWRRGNPCPAAGPFRPWDILERRRGLGVARGT
jgi:hypothetical protein